ncbi:LOW QUALITY PROTEIN: Eukaryotic/viral aspartic protease [Phytophthora megakarya]|uniref:Eukaryotic/viral aspartic protease n=1 Tax=Phytophthora megakarya TaxID=4795 RepID=A0A225WYH4_9STRA|nr:LOW QUALITY PROTEIN: Eukaryotic/viral aspartic protease [Phytophthora megakarya]
MTGDEVCALFGDLMDRPAPQWHLQLVKPTRKSWTEPTDQFRIQYCGKGVSMASRYYHASKHTDQTPLEYLYRLNVAGMRTKIHYADGIPDAATLEKKLRACQRGLAHQKKTLIRSNKFRQKPPATTPSPSRAVHGVQMTIDEYDSGREGYSRDDQYCEQNRDEEDQTRLLVTGHAPLGKNPRREFDSGNAGLDRPKCRHYGARRHAEGDCWSLLTCQKRARNHPTDRYLQACKACIDVHEAGKCTLEEFFNQLRQRFDHQKQVGMPPLAAEKMLNKIDRWRGNQSREGVRKQKSTPNDNTCETEAVRTAQHRVPRVAAIPHVDEYAREPFSDAKIHGKLNNRKAVSVLDTGAEVDTTFAREVGCQIDTSVTQECVGIRDETYLTVKTHIKITLAGDLVYYADLGVRGLVGQHAILGMDVMIPAGVRIDAADGTACLPDEVRIQLIGRRPLYGSKMRAVNIPSLTPIAIGVV